MFHALCVVVVKKFCKVNAQKFYYHATEWLNYQSVFFVAEFALFHRLTEDAAVQIIVDATRASPWHVLFRNVSALLDFMNQAGKGGGSPDAALFQHADEGRLRVVRLQFANVHAGLQFIVFDAGAGGNGLKKRPTRRRRIIRFGFGDNEPTRKLGAFHGVPVLALVGCRNAGRQCFSRARCHTAFGRVPPNHAIQALFFRSHGFRHFKTMQ